MIQSKLIRVACMAVLLGSLPFSLVWADGESDDGLYIEGTVGKHLNTKTNFRAEDPDRTGHVYLDGKNLNGTVAVGYEVGHLRFDGEFVWMTYGINDAVYKSISLPVPLTQVNDTNEIAGEVEITAFMANIEYDVEIRYNAKNKTKEVPYFYFGFGVGVAQARIDSDVELLGRKGTATGSDHAFMYQVTGGIAYKVNPRLELFAEGRLMYVDGMSFNQKDGSKITSGGIHMPYVGTGIRWVLDPVDNDN